MTDIRQHVIIDYTNWRGERSLRRIIPLSIQFENSEWHPDTQWILYAVDIDRGASREFAMANVHSWTIPLPVAAATSGERQDG
jgi:predicted DNA-binding transcriptional regulator YafY